MNNDNKFEQELERSVKKADEMKDELDDIDSDDPFVDAIRNGIEEWKRMGEDLLKKVKEHYEC